MTGAVLIAAIIGGVLLLRRASGGAPVSYVVDASKPYGPFWKARRPPGLPIAARQASMPGAAYDAIDLIAREYVDDPEFGKLVVDIARSESGGTYARPANAFDARASSAQSAGAPKFAGTLTDGPRPDGATYTTAWGAFQLNAASYRDLPGVPPDGFPWDASPREELAGPIARYAARWQQIRSAGGDKLAAARGVRIYQASPALFMAFRARPTEEGWRAVASSSEFARKWTGVVDKHLKDFG